MLTPQDIQEKEFSKAVFGGYDMTGVDDFLEEVTESYTALYKENAILKGKIKVLVEKVEEYRSTEDAMRMALLTAQKMSDDMTEEAKEKSDEIIKAAEREANEKIENLQKEYAEEEARLEAAKKQTAKFVSASRAIIEKHTEFLNKLYELNVEFGGVSNEAEEVISYDEPIKSPEPEPNSTVSAAQEAKEDSILDETLRQIDAAMDKVANEEPEKISQQIFDDGETKALPNLESLKAKPKGWTDEDETMTPRPKFDFSDLKFGSNYKDED